MIKFSAVRLATSILLCSAAGLYPANAEMYPSRAVKIVAAIPAGSANDVIARILANKLTQRAKGQFYVENLPGAGGTTGAAAASRAPADGYTILIINQDFVIQPSMKAAVPYEPFTSFDPVTMVAAAPEAIVVHPSVPAKTMKELIELMKASPGKYNYASPGHGTSPHLASERLFKLSNRIDIAHVAFQGGGPAVTSTIGGHTQVLHITLPLVSAYIKDGTLRGLAVASKTRAALVPDVPTLEEAGFPGHEVGFWTGLVVPAGTPKTVTDWLNRNVAEVLAQADVKDQLASMGFEPLPSTPEALTTHMKREAASWSKIVQDAQIKTN